MSPTDPTFSKYALPISLSEIDTTSPMKLWPYGVQGGDHPSGHPGIDFVLVVGGSVLADQKGTIIDVASSVTAQVIRYPFASRHRTLPRVPDRPVRARAHAPSFDLGRVS